MSFKTIHMKHYSYTWFFCWFILVFLRFSQTTKSEFSPTVRELFPNSQSTLKISDGCSIWFNWHGTCLEVRFLLTTPMYYTYLLLDWKKVKLLTKTQPVWCADICSLKRTAFCLPKNVIFMFIRWFSKDLFTHKY